MSDREKLTELLMDKPFGRATEEEETAHIEDVADYLISNGVVVREKGEWLERYNEGYEMWFYDCPFCDDGYSMKQRDKSKPNFCHNCGADMRKGENG